MKNNFFIQALIQIAFIIVSLFIFFVTYSKIGAWAAVIGIGAWYLLNSVFLKRVNPSLRVSAFNVISFIFFILLSIVIITFLLVSRFEHTTSFNLILSNAWGNYLLPLLIIFTVVGVPLLLYMWVRTILKKKR
ncbi:MAG: hypothetical protein A2481_02885 [Candidatus Yonathbacteria bacterium RIFOXYC2_FULL_47_9]|nr:MAG: hypothetical protein A2481_02885 [Candidatus Yonathbacteria bacterium RIFOXYC2_FULL_47_9]HAT68098.1 hypothetical protein [Candidatus Yonathbacteria bacterium]